MNSERVRMRVSVLLIFFSLSCAELQRGDDQPVPEEDVQSRLNRLQNQTREERPELLTDQTTVQCDVWSELRELRDMVVEQRVKLQYSEHQIEELKKENAELAGRVTSTELKVTSTDLRVNSAELGVEALKEENKKLLGRVTSTELGVEALREENKNTPKVAFSFGSGLSGILGPFNTGTMLVFKKEFVNVGNAYSPITGIFIAPLRGVYFFRLNTFGNSGAHWMGAQLFKNEELILFVGDYPNDGKNEYAINGVSLLLEKGDLMYVQLRAGEHVFDDHHNHCTFSGFLLFPM